MAINVSIKSAAIIETIIAASQEARMNIS